RAVITDASMNSSQVYFIRDGKARVAVVQLGAKDGDSTQILSGIAPNATVAVDHLQDLYDGVSVQVKMTQQSSTNPLSSVTAQVNEPRPQGAVTSRGLTNA